MCQCPGPLATMKNALATTDLMPRTHSRVLEAWPTLLRLCVDDSIIGQDLRWPAFPFRQPAHLRESGLASGPDLATAGRSLSIVEKASALDASTSELTPVTIGAGAAF